MSEILIPVDRLQIIDASELALIDFLSEIRRHSFVSNDLRNIPYPSHVEGVFIRADFAQWLKRLGYRGFLGWLRLQKICLRKRVELVDVDTSRVSLRFHS